MKTKCRIYWTKKLSSKFCTLCLSDVTGFCESLKRGRGRKAAWLGQVSHQVGCHDKSCFHGAYFEWLQDASSAHLAAEAKCAVFFVNVPLRHWVKSLQTLCQNIASTFLHWSYIASPAVQSLGNVAEAGCWLAGQFIGRDCVVGHCSLWVVSTCNNGKRNCRRKRIGSFHRPVGAAVDASDHNCKTGSERSDVLLQQISSIWVQILK